MTFNRDLNRIMYLLIVAFGTVAISTFFWAIIERDNLLARDDNPRRVLQELNVQRGRIYDRDEILLAYTEPAANPAQGATRIYPYPQAVSAVGHYSYQFGQSGLEEGFDSLLRADDLRSTETHLLDDLLNRWTVGGDVRSTLDLPLQLALYEAMDGFLGAAIVAHVPSGRVLAMVSLPSYDPNQISASEASPDGDQTITRPQNRVTTGQYQPGGALQTLLLSGMLAAGTPPDQIVSSEAYVLDTEPPLGLACALPGDSAELTLQDAYLRGCPAPFINAVGEAFSLTSFEDILNAAGFGDTPQLSGIIIPQVKATRISAGENPAASAAGQGELTVTPLHMLQVIAAVVNAGNGIPLHLADATRYPPDSEWQPVRFPPAQQLALMQPGVAQAIEMMLQARSFSESVPVYGHVSQAFAGEREYAWFLGWTPLNDGSSVVIVIVLEAPAGALSPLEAAAAAQTALEEAAARLNQAE